MRPSLSVENRSVGISNKKQEEVHMLGKPKSENEEDLLEPNPISERPRTIIGEQISVKGSIRGQEDLLVQGSVEGGIDLEGHHVTVGTHGQLEGDVHADNVTISGQVVGNVKVLDKVEITKEAEFNGEIKAKRISVEEGAFLKATIELEREPQAKVDSEPSKEPIALVGEAERRA
jgi:cytoskeletal protein CcmA (bactofilin family)